MQSAGHTKVRKLSVVEAALMLIALCACAPAKAPPGSEQMDQAALESCIQPPSLSPTDSLAQDGSFEMISSAAWDETSVRQVLHVFAFGGFATDSQIAAWANMEPNQAIVEMLTLDLINPKLSPADPQDNYSETLSTLSCASMIWSSNNKYNRFRPADRARFQMNYWNAPQRTWVHLAAKRGVNTFRQRIGLWATNYHMAVNLDAGVTHRQVFHFYDSITADLAARKPFQEVLINAALSAAIATQYGHRENRFVNGRFYGNEDFAREFYQLFFGILGFASSYTHDYHEFTTIPNMAKALTDIRVPVVEFADGSEDFSPISTIGTDYHYPADLEIFKANISGSSAQERVQTLGQLAISSEESLRNLPVMIVSVLADDTMDETRAQMVRNIWANLEQKDLLTFLRKYAISTAFHNSSRVKYWTAIERNLLQAHLNALTNHEHDNGFYNSEGRMNDETVQLFRPNHNVFGHQTGAEAASSSDPFKLNYERAISSYWTFARSEHSQTGWEKNWAAVLRPNAEGRFMVTEIAGQLWNRFIADGGHSLGIVERYHLYALLASGQDLALYINEDDPDRVVTAEELAAGEADPTSPLGVELTNLRSSALLLASTSLREKRTANSRVGMAVNFITATPFAFFQEGRSP